MDAESPTWPASVRGTPTGPNRQGASAPCPTHVSSLPTEHGPLHLPAFFPDATKAVVRSLDAGDLEACGVQGLVVNTFHLASHPGTGAIASLGGVHAFMGWPGPVLSDSGGFQVYSLLAHSSRLGEVTRKGFHYRLSPGGRKSILTPERCIRKQFQMGADIVVCLDHCMHPDRPTEEHRRSVEHTLLWAQSCRSEFDRLAEQTGRRPLLFAVVQGGDDRELRRQCTEQLLEIGFDGYGFGGWPVTKGGRLRDMVGYVAELVPSRYPLWGLGIGKPEQVVESVALGYGLFDCVIPTRDARHRRLYVFRSRPLRPAADARGLYERLYLQDRKHVRDDSPLDPECDCLCCRRYSRAYLHHLFQVGDGLAHRLATIHNLRFFTELMQSLRGELGR